MLVRREHPFCFEVFYINYEECKLASGNKDKNYENGFYINYEECKFDRWHKTRKKSNSFILTMRNVNKSSYKLLLLKIKVLY